MRLLEAHGLRPDTDLGQLFLRIIAMRFDAYLARRPANYSKTV